MTIPNETLNNTPEIEEVYAKIQKIREFIELKVAGCDPVTDDDWSDGTVTQEREFPPMRQATGLMVFCRSTDVVEGNGTKDNLRILILRNDEGSTSLNINKDGTLNYYSEATDGDDHTGVKPEEAISDPGFIALINNLASAVDEVEVSKKEYIRFPVPTQITTSELSQEDKDALQEQNNPNVLFKPLYKMETEGKDVWLVSQLAEWNKRFFAVLYRVDPETGEMSQSVVYTSSTQSTWRLIPRVSKGRSGEKDLFDKGIGGEESLSLPISLQQSLWGLQETAAREKTIETLDRSTLDEQIIALTEDNYDTFLAGAESGAILIDEEDDTTDLLPETSDSLPISFTFISPRYGEVTASVVPSRDKSIKYLIFTNDEGISWVGMAEPVDAQMLESFVLDKVVRSSMSSNSIYEPPMEYDYSKKSREISDNADAATNSLVIRAIRNRI